VAGAANQATFAARLFLAPIRHSALAPVGLGKRRVV
jgi:hypothetical protein